MANIYVRSTDGSDADNGSTWALAKATLAGAMAIAAAGDRIFVSHVHAESAGGTTINITSPGTLASPCEILCGNDGAEPPTSLATTATISNSGNNNINLNGSFYCYGIIFIPASPTGLANCNILQSTTTNDYQSFDSCQFRLSSSSSARLNIAANAQGFSPAAVMKNCTFKFGNAAQTFQLLGNSNLHIIGGSIDASGTLPTAPFAHIVSSRGGALLVEDMDLSFITSAMFAPIYMAPGPSVIFRNCKLGAAVSVISGSFSGAGRTVRLHNCDSADTNYRFAEHSFEGVITQSTVLVKTGGATDGTTPVSFKMVSSADAQFPIFMLSTPEAVIWNETTGSARTITVDILHDSVTNLKDDEVWLEVEYLGTSGFPIATHITDRKTNILSTAADQTASSATWTTTGLTNPNKQKLEVTFTPAEKGPIIARVRLAKASYTIYVDPVLQVT